MKSDRRGQASAPGATGGTWRAKNASQFGVVYGGMMEFEATLTGGGWLEQLRKLGLTSGGAAKFSVKVGDARHTGSAQLAVRTK